MLMTLLVIGGISIGFLIGYSYAYSEIVDRAFSSKVNNETIEISSGDKKATMIVKSIEVEK